LLEICNILQLAFAEVAIRLQPRLNVSAVTLDPVNLSPDGIKTLLNGTVEALKGESVTVI
jgi:hypothetical protein